jgi:3-oxoacyl-[acyl-carrier-protein] synthase II
VSGSDVVITGLGAITPFGVGAAAVRQALLERRTAFAASAPTMDAMPPLEPFLSARVAETAVSTVLGKKGLRAVNPESQLFIAAAQLALREAGVDSANLDPTHIGLFAGTVRGGLDEYLRYHIESLVWGMHRVSATRGPNTGFNAPASHGSIRLKLQAANMTLSSRTAASLDAISQGADFIRKGRARYILAGGIETFSYAAADALHADGQVPSGPPRPYDAQRGRPVPGEGAVVLLLETRENARARGAKILATVGAWATAFEPAMRGANVAAAGVRSLKGALSREGIEAQGIGAIFSSAAGSVETDAAEARALGEVFGPALSETPLCAVKGTAGEWDGASGALQALAAVQTLAEGVLPPTGGTESVDPALPRMRIPKEPLAGTYQRALVHVLDPSGRSSTLILRGAEG